MHYIIDGDKT